jgi:flavoprotein
MMRKVEAEDFPVYIVPVDLEEGKKKGWVNAMDTYNVNRLLICL